VKAATPPPPLFWTGFYVGSNVGGGFSHDPFFDNFLPFGPPIGAVDASPRPSGWVGGLQAGYNYQINSILLGLEGGFTWLGTKSSFSCFALLAPQTCTADPEWVAAVTGRLGVVTGPALFYVKGGAAVTDNRYSVFSAPGGFVLDRVSASRWGASAGAGFEYAFAPNWSVGFEYDHLFMGTRDINDGFLVTDNIKQDVDLFTARVNYKFGGPIVARY